MAFFNPYPYQTYGQPTAPQAYQTPAVNQTGIIWVSGEQEAQMYPVAPNNAVALWDRSGTVLYLKTADMTGRPAIRTYDLVERHSAAADGAFPTGGKTTPDYAAKSDLEALAGVVRGLRADLDALKEAEHE